MGALVQTVYETEAAELRMLGHLGVDATTLGNHEFDYRSEGLANMLTSAKASGDELPELVMSNINWEAMETAGLIPLGTYKEYRDFTVFTDGKYFEKVESGECQ